MSESGRHHSCTAMTVDEYVLNAPQLGFAHLAIAFVEDFRAIDVEVTFGFSCPKATKSWSHTNSRY